MKSKYDIRYLDSRYNRYGTMAVNATSIMDAKNQCKAVHPYAKNISCVKRGESVSFGTNGKISSATESNSSDSSLGSMLLGAAVTVGVGLLSSFFNKKNDDSDPWK